MGRSDRSETGTERERERRDNEIETNDESRLKHGLLPNINLLSKYGLTGMGKERERKKL